MFLRIKEKDQIDSKTDLIFDETVGLCRDLSDYL